MGKVKINSEISNDPFSRISPALKKILLEGDVFIDVHSHVFNYRDVPDTFLGIRVPVNDRILSTLENILHRINNSTDADKLSKLAYFIHFLKTRTTVEITEKLIDSSCEKNFVTCPLMVDMAPGIKGKVIDDFQIQIEKMRALKNIFPLNILPFLALDPNNPLIRENFQKVFARTGEYNFFGVKIYPSLGYLPSNPILMDLFRICEEKRIPVTAHCSGASVHTNKKQIVGIQGYHLVNDGSFSDLPLKKRFRKRADYAVFFNHPDNWIPVLEKFPELKLNLAHFGGDEAWKEYSTGKSGNWVNNIISLMARFKNLYADFSYTLYDSASTNSLKNLITENPVVSKRVLYGSDYYMIVTEGHFRALKNNFSNIMGSEIMKQLTKENPMRFLFG